MAQKKKKKPRGSKIFNKRARYEYEVLEKIEAGMVLSGPEVKSLRLGRANLRDSFVRVKDGRATIHNLSISPYSFADNSDYQEKRTRPLLMHKKEIVALESKLDSGNYTLVPLEIYLSKKKFKVLVGLARGKKTHEKRAVLRQRDMEREVLRDLKQRIR